MVTILHKTYRLFDNYAYVNQIFCIVHAYIFEFSTTTLSLQYIDREVCVQILHCICIDPFQYQVRVQYDFSGT